LCRLAKGEGGRRAGDAGVRGRTEEEGRDGAERRRRDISIWNFRSSQRLDASTGHGIRGLTVGDWRRSSEGRDGTE
jgi:hypothetical protein